MIARLKVMSNMNIAEKRIPQDGRFKLNDNWVAEAQVANPTAGLHPQAFAIAGTQLEQDLGAGEAAKIMTGAPCPAGTSAVVPKEQIELVEEGREAMAQEGRKIVPDHLSPLDGVGPEELGLHSLAARLDSGEVAEVILATNTTVEGEATALYLEKLIAPMDVTVTRLAENHFRVVSGSSQVDSDLGWIRAHLPSDDPPVTIRVFHGFFASPKTSMLPEANSHVFILPIQMAPACRRLLATTESSGAM